MGDSCTSHMPSSGEDTDPELVRKFLQHVRRTLPPLASLRIEHFDYEPLISLYVDTHAHAASPPVLPQYTHAVFAIDFCHA